MKNALVGLMFALSACGPLPVDDTDAGTVSCGTPDAGVDAGAPVDAGDPYPECVTASSPSGSARYNCCAQFDNEASDGGFGPCQDAHDNYLADGGWGDDFSCGSCRLHL